MFSFMSAFYNGASHNGASINHQPATVPYDDDVIMIDASLDDDEEDVEMTDAADMMDIDQDVLYPSSDSKSTEDGGDVAMTDLSNVQPAQPFVPAVPAFPPTIPPLPTTTIATPAPITKAPVVEIVDYVPPAWLVPLLKIEPVALPQPVPGYIMRFTKRDYSWPDFSKCGTTPGTSQAVPAIAPAPSTPSLPAPVVAPVPAAVPTAPAAIPAIPAPSGASLGPRARLALALAAQPDRPIGHASAAYHAPAHVVQPVGRTSSPLNTPSPSSPAQSPASDAPAPVLAPSAPSGPSSSPLASVPAAAPVTTAAIPVPSGASLGPRARLALALAAQPDRPIGHASAAYHAPAHVVQPAGRTSSPLDTPSPSSPAHSPASDAPAPVLAPSAPSVPSSSSPVTVTAAPLPTFSLGAAPDPSTSRSKRPASSKSRALSLRARTTGSESAAQPQSEADEISAGRLERPASEGKRRRR